MLSFAFVLLTGIRGVSAPTPQTVAVPASALRILQTNAVEARENAAIYQWVRVNREVDRIVASEKALQRALGTSPARQKQAESLRQNVSLLRKARLDRDIAHITEATHALEGLVRELQAE